MFTNLLTKYIRFIQSDFLKNVSVLTFGSIAGQFVLLCIAPILTRIYSPEQFGSLSVFTSIVVISTTFATGKYEFAIMLPKEDEDGVRIVLIGLILSLIFSLLLFIIIISFSTYFLYLPFFKNEKLWALLIPFCTAFGGINTCLGYFIMRKEMYKAQSIYNFFQATVVSTLNLLLGSLGLLSIGLVVSYTITLLICFFILLILLKKNFGIIKNTLLNVNFLELKTLATRYINFPKFHLWTQSLTNFIQHITPLIFITLYSALAVGFFSLANRIIRLPIIIISSSITSVFRNEVLKVVDTEGGIKKIYISTIKKLIILSLPVFLALYFLLPILFQIVFGDAWYMAGVYGRLMCVMIFFDFISMPITQSIFIIKEAQKINLITQVIGTVLSILGIYIGYYFYNDIYYSILFYSVLNAIYSIITLKIAYNLSI